MRSETSEEKVQLIGGENSDANDAHNEDVITDHEDQSNSSLHVKKLNLKGAFLVMICYTIGTNVLVIPHTVLQLEVTIWIPCILVILFVQFLFNYLLIISTRHVLDDCIDEDHPRDVLQKVADAAFGPRMRALSVVIMYAASISGILVILLVSASILSDVIQTKIEEEENITRVWVTIVVVLIIPFMYLGNYVDMKLTAAISTITSVIALVGVVINCLLYRYTFLHDELLSVQSQQKPGNFLITLGTLVYCTTFTITIPNVTSVTEKRDKLVIPLVCCVFSLAIVIISSAMVPYLTFRENILDSTISTFYFIINNHPSGTGPFKIITILIQILMVIHLASASVIVMNPLYLHLEEVLAIPSSFNMKRVACRSCVMLSMLVVCLAIPSFEFVISISGALVYSVIGIIMPLLFYVGLFKMKVYQKVFIYFFLFIVILLIIGNVFFSIIARVTG